MRAQQRSRMGSCDGSARGSVAAMPGEDEDSGGVVVVGCSVQVRAL